MATIMRFLISILLLLSLPVYGQFNPTPFSKGQVNTNDTAAKWRAGIEALHGVETTLYDTNYFTTNSPIIIGGSSLPNVNGTYTISHTNIGAGWGGNNLIVWTNSTATYKIVAYDPESADQLQILLETDLGQIEPPYFGSLNADNLPVEIEPLYGPSDTITMTYATNAIIDSFKYSEVRDSTLVYGTTNLLVDPINGSDKFGNKTLGIPYQSIYKASLNAVSNDWIVALPGFHIPALGTPAYISNGVTLSAYGATIREAVVLTGGATILGGTYLSAPHYYTTNPATTTITRDIEAHSWTGGDGIVIDSAVGRLEWYNCNFGSTWDACIIQGSKTNSVMEFNNCKFSCVFDPIYPISVSWGYHCVGWNIDTTGGGKLILNDCYLVNLNSTNATFTNPAEPSNANAGIIINPETLGVTTYGMASIELNNVTIKYGSTNVGVVVNAISNVLNVPITGSYLDIKAGSDITKTNTRTTYVNFSGESFRSNSVSLWPTAASHPGASYIGNSNGVIYLLTSTPSSTAWAATNKLAP